MLGLGDGDGHLHIVSISFRPNDDLLPHKPGHYKHWDKHNIFMIQRAMEQSWIHIVLSI